MSLSLADGPLSVPIYPIPTSHTPSSSVICNDRLEPVLKRRTCTLPSTVVPVIARKEKSHSSLLPVSHSPL
ncbi:hypothetical protein MJO28_001088 [Puccinia striiformis f. sp. tritici]|uniref:Uncharacterized protein n=1 Tax=Puccinia striiformis f. sp. tritici TaxID=168172 RepID=A0ACC0F0U5_9BASI|nr:hypothetical protein MJO28_001088 [Puccinia striiformis f. sp. tritici]KAI7966887.1 hypothetical protein MJO29_000164 [Puccinia striiformis f. sp. tritici]